MGGLTRASRKNYEPWPFGPCFSRFSPMCEGHGVLFIAASRRAGRNGAKIAPKYHPHGPTRGSGWSPIGRWARDHRSADAVAARHSAAISEISRDSRCAHRNPGCPLPLVRRGARAAGKRTELGQLAAHEDEGRRRAQQPVGVVHQRNEMVDDRVVVGKANGRKRRKEADLAGERVGHEHNDMMSSSAEMSRGVLVHRERRQRQLRGQVVVQR